MPQTRKPPSAVAKATQPLATDEKSKTPELPIDARATEYAGVEQFCVRFSPNPKKNEDSRSIGDTKLEVAIRDEVVRPTTKRRIRTIIHSIVGRDEGFFVLVVYRTWTPDGIAAVCADAINKEKQGDVAEAHSGNDLALAIKPVSALQEARSWLTTTAKAMHSGKMGVHEAEDRRRAKAALREIESLADAKIERPKPPEVARLEELIKHFQQNPPNTRAAKEEFVHATNKAMSAVGYRIRLPRGELARLSMAPGKTNKGFIQFQIIATGGNVGGFRGTPITLVPYSRGDAAR